MSIYHKFYVAVEQNDLKKVEQMLVTVEASSDECLALRLAAQYGHLDMVRLLLPHSDPAAKNSTPVALAAENGYLEIVKILAPMSDVSASDWYALREAAGNGHTHVVQWLLPLCPEEAKFSAITAASMGNHFDTVDLLKDKVNFNCHNAWPLDWAARNKNEKIFDLLIPYVDVYQSDDFMEALGSAAFCGHRDMFETIFQHAPEDLVLDQVLQQALLAGRHTIAQQLYPRCNLENVLQQLHEKHHESYKSWAFFDHWVESQRQHATIAQHVEHESTLPTVCKPRKI